MGYVHDDDDPVWDLYEIPESIYPLQEDRVVDVSLPNESLENLKGMGLTNPSSESDIDEDSRIKALVDTPALDWQQPSASCSFGSGRGMRRGRMIGGRGFGRGCGLQWKTPPEGYVCHRCQVAGHFIQHCPTNGDPNYDFKRMKPPTGIPKSMLMVDSDGFCTLPTGNAAVLRPDEAAFEREIEGLPSTRSHVGDVPQELYCQLCKEIMKFAVLSSKCCFQSFCDQCIRSYIISKSMCVCGATKILADDLLPNLTLRKTINRIMESNDGSVENDCSALQVQDMESNNLQAKVPSPRQSVDSSECITNKPIGVEEPAQEESVIWADKEEVAEEGMSGNEGIMQESVGAKEPAPHGRSVPLAYEECEAAKKKREKPHILLDDQWNGAQNFSYMMPMAFAAYNPYWTTGIHTGMAGFLTPYASALPNIGFGVSPMDMSYGGVMPQDQFAGPPLMSSSREEYEDGKSDLKRTYEVERQGSSKDQELDRQVSSSSDVSSMKSKSIVSSNSSLEHHHHRLKRPLPDQQEQDHYDCKRPQRHGDEHHHYQDDKHHHHPSKHHRGSRHHRSVQSRH